MPIYEYECEHCGEKFELFRRISSDDREISCPKCQTKKPRRIISCAAECPSGQSCQSCNITST